VVDAIRAVDVNHLIFVEGPNYSLASHWPVDNPAPFITDTLSPAKIDYSPHVYFDYGNDSQYDGAGEDVGPMEHWEYYVRDRLVAAMDWSIEYDVPLLFGEMGVPCTTEWAAVLDYAFEQFFDPLEVSTAAWQYIDTARWPYLPAPELNLAECETLMEVLSDHPGGVYEQSAELVALPPDSLIYDDVRVNPWHEGARYWGDATVDFASADQVHDGARAISVEFGGDFGGVKFIHSFGIDTSRFRKLSFWIYPTSANLDFRLFSTGPLPDSGEFPAVYGSRRDVSYYVPGGLVPGRWQLVEVPLQDPVDSSKSLVDPDEPVITGIAFQNDGTPAAVFYLDEVRLINAQDELIVDFGQPGLWAWQNDALWWKLHGVSPEGMVAADLDGNGLDELVVNFGWRGLWVWENNTRWYKLHGFDAEDVWAADLDGNGQDEAIIDFGWAGLWVWENNSQWRKLHGVSPESAAAGDLDGNGQDELVIDFGPPGLWVWDNNATWHKLHGADPECLATGNLDGLSPGPAPFGPAPAGSPSSEFSGTAAAAPVGAAAERTAAAALAAAHDAVLAELGTVTEDPVVAVRPIALLWLGGSDESGKPGRSSKALDPGKAAVEKLLAITQA